jgi:hypothetical protein
VPIAFEWCSFLFLPWGENEASYSHGSWASSVPEVSEFSGLLVSIFLGEFSLVSEIRVFYLGPLVGLGSSNLE